MKRVLSFLALVILIPLTVSAALVALPHFPQVEGDAPKPQPGQVRVGEDWVYSTVANLPTSSADGLGGGWVPQTDVHVDQEGYAWISAGAKVRTKKMASAYAKGEPMVQVTRSPTGFGVVVHDKLEWTITQRAELPNVVPVHRWSPNGPGEAIEPVKKKITVNKGAVARPDDE